MADIGSGFSGALGDSARRAWSELRRLIQSHAEAPDPHPQYTAGAISGLALHVAAADPHPVYETGPEVLVRIGTHSAAVDPHGDRAFAAAADLAHATKTPGAHAASAISFTAGGTIAATNAQTAIAEVATDYIAADLAHKNLATAAHNASAIKFTAGGTIAAVNVQTAIAEVAVDYIAADADHVAAADPHPVYETSTEVASKITTHSGATDPHGDRAFATAADTTASTADRAYSDGALLGHTSDGTDAHDASAISVTPVGFISSTDVQSALSELEGEVVGRIEAGDIDAILDALNTGTPSGSGTITRTDIIVSNAIAAGAIVAAKIDANAVTAGKIQAGAVDGTHINAASSITIGSAATKLHLEGTSSLATTKFYSTGSGYGTGTGFFLNAEGKFSLGSTLTYDGAGSLAIVGNVSATQFELKDGAYTAGQFGEFSATFAGSYRDFYGIQMKHSTGGAPFSDKSYLRWDQLVGRVQLVSESYNNALHAEFSVDKSTIYGRVGNTELLLDGSRYANIGSGSYRFESDSLTGLRAIGPLAISELKNISGASPPIMSDPLMVGGNASARTYIGGNAISSSSYGTLGGTLTLNNAGGLVSVGTGGIRSYGVIKAGPDGAQYTVLNGNQLEARTAGGAISTLYLNYSGGYVSIGGGGTAGVAVLGGISATGIISTGNGAMGIQCGPPSYSGLWYNRVLSLGDGTTGRAGITFRNGGRAPQLFTDGSSGGLNWMNEDVTGWESIYAASFAVMSSIDFKKDIEAVEDDEAIKLAEEFLLASFAPKVGVKALRESDRFTSLNERWVAKGRSVLKAPPREVEIHDHDCTLDDCVGDENTPCAAVRNHKRRYGGLAEWTAIVAPDMARFTDDGGVQGHDVDQIATTALGATGALSRRLTREIARLEALLGDVA